MTRQHPLLLPTALVLVVLLTPACSGSGDGAAATTLAATTTAMSVTSSPPTTGATTSTTTEQTTTTTELSPVAVEGSGTGDEVVEFSIRMAATAVTFTHDGAGVFKVRDLGIDLEPIDVLVETTGSYQGTRPLQWEAASGGFEITADGNWTFTVFDNIDFARHPECPFEGTGDDVVIVYAFKSEGFGAGESRPVDITFDGDTAFDMWIYGFGPTEHIVDATGPFEDTILIAEGMVIWEIVADGGAWTIDCDSD